MENVVIRTAYGPKVKAGIAFPDKGRTKQAHREECDINGILAKFQKTGLLDFVARHSPEYGDVSSVDFQKSMQDVARTKEMFAELPSSVRNHFDNDPAAFLEFIQDPENHEEAIELGLVEPEQDPAVVPLVEPETPPAAPVAPPAAG